MTLQVRLYSTGGDFEAPVVKLSHVVHEGAGNKNPRRLGKEDLGYKLCLSLTSFLSAARLVAGVTQVLLDDTCDGCPQAWLAKPYSYGRSCLRRRRLVEGLGFVSYDRLCLGRRCGLDSRRKLWAPLPTRLLIAH